jgi:uncharacterized protein DUF5994
MTTSPNLPSSPPVTREPLRLRLGGDTALATPDGAWWPRSRDLQTEAADLVDHFPKSAGHINRLLFSRPDWDLPDTGRDGGIRNVMAARGRVKVGSFPSDDTHLMILTMASGQRLKLLVIPSDASPAEGERLLTGAGDPRDDESPRS